MVSDRYLFRIKLHYNIKSFGCRIVPEQALDYLIKSLIFSCSSASLSKADLQGLNDRDREFPDVMSLSNV